MIPCLKFIFQLFKFSWFLFYFKFISLFIMLTFHFISLSLVFHFWYLVRDSFTLIGCYPPTTFAHPFPLQSLPSSVIPHSLSATFHSLSVVSWNNGDGTGLTQPGLNYLWVIFLCESAASSWIQPLFFFYCDFCQHQHKYI